MRREFHPMLLEEMRKNKKIVLLTGDLGYKMWDTIAAEFPDRFFNMGASESLMAGAAVGCALNGYIPIVYSITPFALWRSAETWRIYLNYEQIPCKILAAGRDREYSEDGITHDGTDAKRFLAALPGIKSYFPDTVKSLEKILPDFLYNEKPSFLSLNR